MSKTFQDSRKEKILLLLLPYWSPQVTPMGISCLKSMLQLNGYEVKIADANVEDQAAGIYTRYFEVMKEIIPSDLRGNFYNIGNDVLHHHMMIHLNCNKNHRERYFEVAKAVIYKNFFINVEDTRLYRLQAVIDDFYHWLDSYLSRLFAVENPAVLGLSAFRGTLPASMFALRRAREKYPRIKTVIGGPVFSQTLGIGTENFNRFLKETETYIDHILIGEGEILFLKLLNGELPGPRRVYTLEDTDGETLALESAALPDFTDLKPDLYPNLGAYTSRSCPFQCRFCSETIYWNRYRKKTARQVVEELTFLSQKYGRQLFMMTDSLLNPVVTPLARQMVEARASLYWDGYLRVEQQACDPDTTLLWRRGGFYRARLGVESGAQRLLDDMNKKVTVRQIKAALFNLANAGIKTTTYWLIGYPGETAEEFSQTLALVEELKDYIYEADCNIFSYYLSGQVGSEEWESKNNVLPLYPESAADLLLVQSCELNCPPTRQETIQRMRRFIHHCRRLGIPNPYTLYDIHKADQRWKRLHHNAVPSLTEFENKDSFVKENENVKMVQLARNHNRDSMELDFDHE